MTAVRRGSLARGERGQSIAELAIALPVLILLLLCIMEGGRIMASYLELQNAAREGARYAALNCTLMNVTDDQVAAWADTVLVPWLDARLSLLHEDTLVVNFTRTANLDASEVWVDVDLTYPLEVVTPVISDLTGNPLDLHTGVVMRGE